MYEKEIEMLLALGAPGPAIRAAIALMRAVEPVTALLAWHGISLRLVEHLSPERALGNARASVHAQACTGSVVESLDLSLGSVYGILHEAAHIIAGFADENAVMRCQEELANKLPEPWRSRGYDFANSYVSRGHPLTQLEEACVQLGKERSHVEYLTRTSKPHDEAAEREHCEDLAAEALRAAAPLAVADIFEQELAAARAQGYAEGYENGRAEALELEVK